MTTEKFGLSAPQLSPQSSPPLAPHTSGNATESSSLDSLMRNLIQSTFHPSAPRSNSRVLVIERNVKSREALKFLILNQIPNAVCEGVDSVNDFAQAQKEHNFDVVLANYYVGEADINYEFWDEIRKLHPGVHVIAFSHINDRDYFEALGKLERLLAASSRATKMKQLIENVLGGWHGSY